MSTRSRRTLAGVAIAAAVVGLALSAPGYADAAGHPAAQAAHKTAHKTKWRVTVRADKSTLTLGQKVHLRGKVAKSAAGGLVKLYERGSAEQPWRYQRNALVRRDGHYATYDKPTVNSSRQYRVVMPGNKHHKKGTSAAVTVHVFRWTSLTGFTSVNQTYLAVTPSVAINGLTYPSSLEAEIFHVPTDSPNPQSIEFNVDRKCTRFRATFGLSDDSEAGSQATVAAEAVSSTGTTPFFSQSFGLGQSAATSTTFATAPLKLRFETTSEVSGADGLGAVGTPEVYCER
jgi:hypothetical protein